MARTKKAAEAVEAEVKKEEKTYTEQDVQALVAAAVAKAMAEFQTKQAAPAEKERVVLVWQAPVADENVQEFGPNGRCGRIVGPTGTLFMSKEDFFQILDTMTRMFLDRRWLIVESGLTEQERKAYGVVYREGEYLKPDAFKNITEQGEKLPEIYKALGPSSREIVAQKVYEAWTRKDPSVTRELIKTMIALCKKVNPKETTFATILQEMNASEAE